MISATLTGLTTDWLIHNSSYGDPAHAEAVSIRVRSEIFHGPRRKRGKGTQTLLDLTVEEAVDLASMLVSIAEAGESMTAEERGDDRSAYAAIRRDADRINRAAAETLRAAYRRTLVAYRTTDSDANYAAEQTAWDALVDHVEAAGLNDTEYDPRPAGDE